MLGYSLRRLLATLPTLLIVALSVFVLIRLVPGDPVLVMLGDAADPTQVRALRESMGLEKPMLVQFGLWLERALSGDLGSSITNGAPVLPLILDRFSLTAMIVVTAVALATAIAVPLGMIAAWKQDSLSDIGVVGFATLLLSIPSFWLGLLLLLVFGVWLKWLPVVGYVSLGENPWQALQFVVLPIATLTLIEIGALTRMARASTIDVLRLDYIAHARAKGLSEFAVLGRHALPNAFAPTLTLIGIILGNLLGGIAVIETVFTLPGLGRLLVDAIFARDYPVVQGVMLFVAVIYVTMNLLVDLAYPLFDPRVTLEQRHVLRLNRTLGAGLMLFVGLMAAIAAVWTPYPATGINLRARLSPPGNAYWLGTDEFGRDVLSRLMEGAHTSVTVALVTVCVAVAIGIVIGLAGGFFRGWTDRILMSLNDALLAFPGILLALGLLAVIGPSKWGIVLALGIAYAPTVARIVRGSVLSIREKEFVEASRALGNTEGYTLLRHVLPHTVSPLTVVATSMFGWVVLSESALSFLGLGVPPPAPSWGNMLSAARPFLETAPHLSIAPGIMIAVCLLGANLLGDALRDHLDPRSAA